MFEANEGSSLIMSQVGIRTDTDCTHRFIAGDQAEPGPEPALVLLHDSGANEEQLLSVAEVWARDHRTNVLSLRGWFPYQEGYSFLGTPDDTVCKETCFIERADRISRFLEWAAAEYNLNPGRIIVFGKGDGATLAASLLFVHSELLGGAVLIRPRSPFRPRPLPALPCYPILLVSGQRESVDFRSEAKELADLLFQCGCSVRQVRVPLDHRFDAKLIRTGSAWYRKVSSVDISIECAI
jgi:phospholipase/carboxylesterase